MRKDTSYDSLVLPQVQETIVTTSYKGIINKPTSQEGNINVLQFLVQISKLLPHIYGLLFFLLLIFHEYIHHLGLLADEGKSKLTDHVLLVLVDTLADVTKGFGNSYFTNSKFHALPIELPKIQVLQSTSHKSPRIPGNEAHIFNLIR